MGIQRKTSTIGLLLDQFKKSNQAIAAVELVDRLKEKVNKTTVYRALERLEDDGLVHSFLDRDGIKRYAICQDCNKDSHVHDHPHFQCTNCGKVDCLEEASVNIPKISGRTIHKTDVLLQGICETCSI